MASTRRYHGPGVGGRTGMRVAEDVRSISGYLEAGRRAMDTHDDTRYTYDDDVTREASTSYQRESGHILSSPRPYVSPQSKSINRDRTTVAAASPLAGSSSMAMDLEHSYAPSPQSRRSSRRETMLLSANEFASTSMSNGSDAAGVSMIDYGLEGGDAADETVTADVGGRSAFSIGLNRARQSNFSHADISRRESQGAASFSSDDYQDRQQDVMDFGGEEIPSFRVDDSASLPDAYPAENGYASGEEVDGYVDGSGSGPVEIDDTPSEAEGQGTFLAADEASREDGHQSVEEVDAVEHETNAATSSRKKKGGRTARAGTATDRGVGRGRPKELQGGAMIKERVASSRGRAGSVIDGDVRRSTRHRYAPLEYWRGERAIYGRPSLLNKEQRRSDTADADETIDENVFEDRPARAYSVPVLREIIRFTRAPNEGTFTGMTIKRKRASSHTGSGKHTAKRRTRKATADGSASSEDEVELDPTVPTRHVEDGWDDATDPQGTVWDAENDIEVERVIACPASQVRTKQALNSPFAFEKVFGVDGFMAAGILEIPVGGSKPTKPTKDNAFTFVVLEGAVDVRVHRTLFRMAPGGMFMVPKGNSYSIENCCQRQAKIFFTQARQEQVPQEIDARRDSADASRSFVRPGRHASRPLEPNRSDSQLGIIAEETESPNGYDHTGTPPGRSKQRSLSARAR